MACGETIIHVPQTDEIRTYSLLTGAPAIDSTDLGRANTSSRTSSGNVSLMIEGGEKRRLESPAKLLLYAKRDESSDSPGPIILSLSVLLNQKFVLVLS